MLIIGNNHKLNDTGLSFVELLIAIIILTIGLVFSLHVYSQSFKLRTLTSERLFASSWAESNLEQLSCIPFKDLIPGRIEANREEKKIELNAGSPASTLIIPPLPENMEGSMEIMLVSKTLKWITVKVDWGQDTTSQLEFTTFVEKRF